MRPVSFPEQNVTLKGPEGSGIGDLPTFTDGKEVISCWRATWRQRLIFLLTGRVWLRIQSGYTQPPVCLQVEPVEWRKPLSGPEQETRPLEEQDLRKIVKAALRRARRDAKRAGLALLLSGSMTAQAQVLHWDPSPDPVSHYTVYQASPPDSTLVVIGQTTNTFMQVGPVGVTEWCVTASANGLESEAVCIVYAPTAPPPPVGPPLPPSNLRLEVTELLLNGSLESTNQWGLSGNVRVAAMPEARSAPGCLSFNAGDTVPDGVVAQAFPTRAGVRYQVSLWARAWSGLQAEQRLRVQVRGLWGLADQTFTLAAVQDWTNLRLIFTADAESVVLVLRDASGTTFSTDLLVDDVSVQWWP